MLAGGLPVLGGRSGDEGDVGRNDLCHGITEGSTPLLEFLGDLPGEAQDDSYAQAVPAGAGRLPRSLVPAGISGLAGSP